jgi:hypothetical protein
MGPRPKASGRQAAYLHSTTAAGGRTNQRKEAPSMPAREPIGVTVHLPTSKEGMERLRERLIEVNSDILASALNAIDAPREVKVAYIRSLGGLAPWAKARKERASAEQER